MILILSALAGASDELNARAVTLGPGFQSIELRNQMDRFLDSTGAMDIEEVLAGAVFTGGDESVFGEYGG